MNAAWRSLDNLKQSLGDVGEGVTSYLKGRREEAERERNFQQLKAMQGPGGALEKFDPQILGALFPSSNYDAGATMQGAMRFNEATAPKFSVIGDAKTGHRLLRTPSTALGGDGTPALGEQLTPPRPDKQYGWRDRMVNGAPATEEVGGMKRYLEEEYARDENTTDPGVATGNVRSKGIAGTGAAPDLSDQDVDMLAEQYLITGVLPRIGFGKQGVAVASQIIALASAKQKQRGMSGADLAANQAMFQAHKTSLSNLVKLQTATDTALRTAHENLNYVLKVRPTLAASPSPMVNRFWNWARGEVTGNDDLTRLETAIYTAAREYAKVTSGAAGSTSGLTDTAAKEAEKLLNAAQNPTQLAAAIEAMQVDMANVSKEFANTVRFQNEMVRGMGGRQPQPGDARGGAAPKKRRRYNPTTDTFEDVQ